jgi:hypothetical protein
MSPAPPTAPGPVSAPDASPAMRLQILTAEHASLSATRSLAWNESFTRASMFLTTVSGSIVALALVGQSSGFTDTFALFGVVILPVVLFVGVATFLRMGASNFNDAQCVIGMNRIRAGYLEFAPDMERFFVMGTHDDIAGISTTMGILPGRSALVHVLAATPMVVSVVNSVIAAAIVALVALLLHVITGVVLLLGVVTFLLVLVAHARFGHGEMTRGQASARPQFPTPPGA